MAPGVTWAQAVAAVAAGVQALITATAGLIAYRAYGVNRQSSVEGRVARLDVGVSVDVASVGDRHLLRVGASAHNRATAPVVVATDVPPVVTVHALSPSDLDTTGALADSERWAVEHAVAASGVLATGTLPAGVTVRDTVLLGVDPDPATVGYRIELLLKLADVGAPSPDTWSAVTYAGVPRDRNGLQPAGVG